MAWFYLSYSNDALGFLGGAVLFARDSDGAIRESAMRRITPNGADSILACEIPEHLERNFPNCVRNRWITEDEVVAFLDGEQIEVS